MNNSFVFYATFLETVDKLNAAGQEDLANKVLRAIIDVGIYGEYTGGDVLVESYLPTIQLNIENATNVKLHLIKPLGFSLDGVAGYDLFNFCRNIISQANTQFVKQHFLCEIKKRKNNTALLKKYPMPMQKRMKQFRRRILKKLLILSEEKHMVKMCMS